MRLLPLALFSLASCEPAPSVPQAEPLTVAMVDLEKAFEANEVGAIATYGGRPLIISGSVRKVILGIDDQPVINMEGSGLLPVGVPIPDEDKVVAGTLREGTLITVTCYKVEEMMAKPLLSDCRLNPTSDWPVVGEENGNSTSAS